VPFREMNAFRIPSAVVKGQRPALPPDVSRVAPRAYLELMKACWNASQQKRPSFSQILQRLGDMATPIPVDNLEDVARSKNWSEYSSDSETSESNLSNSTASSINMQELERTTLQDLTVMLQAKRIKSTLVTEDFKLKALRSRKYHVKAARKAIQTHITFIKYYNQGKPITIQSVRRAFELQVLTVYGGVCVDGGPVILFNANRHFVEILPVNDLVRGIMYCIERANEMSGAFTAGVTMLVNVENWAMKNYSMKFSSVLATILKELPFILKNLICVDSPWWMSKMYAVFSGMMGKALWSKMRIIDRAALATEYITSENLLPEMKGTFDFDLNQWLRTRYEIEKIEYIP